ncbi:MAG: hypothetical protein RI883_1869 [Bacteroidota bacterium]|jgi:hypothetical protein
MKELKSYAELQNYFNNEAFVLKTQQQISKDFAKFNLFFSDLFEIDPFSKEEIEIQIADQLADIMKQGETRLMQLLYTIDVAEKDFLQLTTQPNFLQELSHKILYREAYKVYLRMKFSS